MQPVSRCRRLTLRGTRLSKKGELAMNEIMMNSLLKMTLLFIVLIGLFTYMVVSMFVNARRRERESHYRNDFRKKLIEQWGSESAEKVIEMLKEESQDSEAIQLLKLAQDQGPSDPARRKEKLMLAGLVTTALGIGLCIGLQFIAIERIWTLGFIPLLVGIAILIHAFFFIHV